MGGPQAEGSPFAHGNRCDLGILVAVVVERAETRQAQQARESAQMRLGDEVRLSQRPRMASRRLARRWAATRGAGYFTGTEGAHNRAIVRDCWASALPANGIHSRLRVKKSTASMSHRVGEMA